MAAHTVQHSVIVTVTVGEAGQAGMQEGMLCLHWSSVPRYTWLKANVLPGNSCLTNAMAACFIARIVIHTQWSLKACYYYYYYYYCYYYCHYNASV